MKTKNKYEKEICATIEKDEIIFIEDIFCYYGGISRSQFYNIELNKSDTLLKAMSDNKIKLLQGMRAKWYKSDNSALQIALFKLLCTDAERRKLAINYNEVEHSGKIITVTVEND